MSVFLKASDIYRCFLYFFKRISRIRWIVKNFFNNHW